MEDKKIWRKFLIELLVITTLLMLAVAGFVICVDPFFHYHGPLESFSYILNTMH